MAILISKRYPQEFIEDLAYNAEYGTDDPEARRLAHEVLNKQLETEVAELRLRQYLESKGV